MVLNHLFRRRRKRKIKKAEVYSQNLDSNILRKKSSSSKLNWFFLTIVVLLVVAWVGGGGFLSNETVRAGLAGVVLAKNESMSSNGSSILKPKQIQ